MMEKIDQGHPLSQSTDFMAQNIETLKTLFPTIVKEGKIDIKELQALLGDDVETEEEYYRFTWAGKSMARREANKPSTATLRPDKESSKDWDTTQNIFIEGDNLEVLKLLQKSYANKIKMIYIDPPYNTGKDFVYKDNYYDNLGNYLAITGQVDEEGKRINTNSESDGRYHSNWLNMMYPRLKLARNLLKEDGVIFISIDDNEMSNLRKICDEVFGSENFIGTLSVENNPKGRKNSNFISVSSEYLHIYAKNIDQTYFVENIPKNASDMTEDEDGNFVHNSGKRILVGENSFNNIVTNINSEKNYSVYFKKEDRSIHIIKEKLGEFQKDLLERGYIKYHSFHENNLVENTYTTTKFKELFELGALEFTEQKIFEKNFNDKIRIKSQLVNRKYDAIFNGKKVKFSLELTTTGSGTLLKELFDTTFLYFEAPKNVGFLKILLTLFDVKDYIILDFFAGSGTTAHATLQLNAEDGGNRKFICVQLPEPTDEKSEAYKAGYMTISEITKERIRRAGDKIKSEMKDDLFSEQAKTLDVGFRAFKLDSSNISAWDGNPDALEDNLFHAGSNIKANRTEEDVLYEILLKYGLDLTMPIEQKAIAGKQVFNIGMGALFICLGDNITTTVAEGIGKWKEELQPATSKVIFKDTGFTDVEKTNSMQILKRYGILEVNTI